LKYIHSRLTVELPFLRELRDRLKTALKAIKGCIVEDKGYSLSVHFRLVREDVEVGLKRRFWETVSPYIKKGHFRVTRGKKVLEVRPRLAWHKGKALRFIINSVARGSFPVYLGDDKTDEDAFRVIRDKGLGVYVGVKLPKSYANYFLKNTDEVSKFLELLTER